MKKFEWNKRDYYDTFPLFLAGIRDKFGDKPAVTWYDRKGGEHSRSYAKLAEETDCLRRAMRARGLSGKRIALVGENSYEWIVAYLAVAAEGGCAVCIDAEQPDECIWQMMELAETEAVFASCSCLPICKSIPSRTERILLFALLGEGEKEITWEQLCREGKNGIWSGAETARKADGSDADDPEPGQTAAIVFTSGTTSTSKAVMLSHRAVLHNASSSSVYVDAGETVFSSLPFYHTYGMTCAVLATLVRGAHLFINGDLKTVMRDLHFSGAYSMLTVPLMVETIHNQIWLAAEREGLREDLTRALKVQRLMNRMGIKSLLKPLEELREKSVGSLRVIICGGAHLSREIAEEFLALGVLILEGYGITECSPLVAVNSNHSWQMDSVGYVLPDVEVKVEDGEICVRGVSVMNGYYNEPELTAEVMDGEWFHTGDLGHLDREGFLYITGRIKNLIVFKNGKKLSPEKLEEKLSQIPLVKDVVVYGAASGSSADDVKVAASVYPDQERAAGLSSYEILEQLQSEIDRINASLPLYQQI